MPRTDYRLLRPAEVAERLAISERTLRALSVAGEIRYVSLKHGGGREIRRYDPADVEAFIDTRRSRVLSLPQPSKGSSLHHIAVIDFTACRQAKAEAKRAAKSVSPLTPKEGIGKRTAQAHRVGSPLAKTKKARTGSDGIERQSSSRRDDGDRADVDA